MLTRLSLTHASGVIDAEAIADIAAPAARTAPGGTLRAESRTRIREVYRGTGQNISETARRLGVSRNTVYRALGAAED